MKIILYLVVALCLITAKLTAQDAKAPRVHQIGIQFNSLNSFGVHYKTGSEKTLFRVTLVALNATQNYSWGRTQDSIDQKQRGFGAGFTLGFEKLIPLAKDFDFRWGLEVGSSYQYEKYNYSSYYPDSETSYWSINPGVYLIIGVSYILKEHFVFGAEISPGVVYSYGKQKIISNGNMMKETTNNSFRFGLNSNSASLSVAYRFGK
ncbi:MAG: hypothetical protein NT004_17170 [Bacteroidetes bacterium]|nr:hypothetical protein [Bacteroidota bacterium]